VEALTFQGKSPQPARFGSKSSGWAAGVQRLAPFNWEYLFIGSWNIWILVVWPSYRVASSCKQALLGLSNFLLSNSNRHSDIYWDFGDHINSSSLPPLDLEVIEKSITGNEIVKDQNARFTEEVELE
jgi:hypothetical protein